MVRLLFIASMIVLGICLALIAVSGIIGTFLWCANWDDNLFYDWLVEDVIPFLFRVMGTSFTLAVILGLIIH